MENIPFSNISPLTFFYTNEFSHIFQVITDTYGVPTYKEANPSVLTSITFPFFFGIMFGDIGHGSILMIAGGLLTIFADKLRKYRNPSVKNLLHMRYLLLLMGFFATYMGFIYNDFMSLATRVFPSCYEIEGIHRPKDPLKKVAPTLLK